MSDDLLPVTGFGDYRGYLRAHYEWSKKHVRGFSYRSFSRKAGLRSPNYLKLVIEGQRRLSGAMAARFAGACGLKGAEADFFVGLVALDNARGEGDTTRAEHQLRLFAAAAAKEGSQRQDGAMALTSIVQVSSTDLELAIDIVLMMGLAMRQEDGTIRWARSASALAPAKLAAPDRLDITKGTWKSARLGKISLEVSGRDPNGVDDTQTGERAPIDQLVDRCR